MPYGSLLKEHLPIGVINVVSNWVAGITKIGCLNQVWCLPCQMCGNVINFRKSMVFSENILV